jgi:hypothetical protein
MMQSRNSHDFRMASDPELRKINIRALRFAY